MFGEPCLCLIWMIWRRRAIPFPRKSIGRGFTASACACCNQPGPAALILWHPGHGGCPPDREGRTVNTQVRLLGARRFMPLFATQTLGAFNDNLFKSAFVM